MEYIYVDNELSHILVQLKKRSGENRKHVEHLLSLLEWKNEKESGLLKKKVLKRLSRMPSFKAIQMVLNIHPQSSK